MKSLNKASLDRIDEIVAAHKDEYGPTIVMLHDVQKELGYIPVEAMEKIADATNQSISKVYGVVTFYSQFTTAPRGKHVINVCLGTACYVKGSQAILDEIISLTHAPVNGTSEDGIFSIDATRCLGACGLAPVAVVDGVVYGNVADDPNFMNMIVDLIQKEQDA